MILFRPASQPTDQFHYYFHYYFHLQTHQSSSWLPPPLPLPPNHKQVSIMMPCRLMIQMTHRTTNPELTLVDLATVPTPQLTQLKNQLTQDLAQLTSSFTQLRGAQTKFRDCISSVRDGVASKKEGWLLFFRIFHSLNQLHNSLSVLVQSLFLVV